MKTTCLVIGAGAAGLMAARQLLKHDHDVLTLEARDRIGGRIYTTHIKPFSQSIELGAEFIHGETPFTMALLREADIQHEAMGGKAFQVRQGEISRGDFFNNEWEPLLNALKKVEHDMPFAEFLQHYFAEEKHNALRHKVKGFVEGYNAANINTASTMALREEWTADEDPKQMRPTGGYGKMMEHMRSHVEAHGGIIRLASPVNRVEWQRSSVKVFTPSQVFEGNKLVVTVPVGVLQRNVIQFVPSLTNVNTAAKDFGFGNVVKLHFEFSTPIWEPRFKKPGFLFSDARIPTWWTQLPDQVSILTGWLGGPGAEKLSTPEQWCDEAIHSLAYLLKEKPDSITRNLKAWHVSDWHNDHYSYGAYSFSTLKTASAKNILNTPIAETIYFAGEALNEGPQSGTVEAALMSGKHCAEKIGNGLQH